MTSYEVQTITHLYVGLITNEQDGYNKVNEDDLYKILDELFEGYTVLPATGVWQGKKEPSVQIVLVGASPISIRRAIYRIKTELYQDAVLRLDYPHVQASF